MVFSDSQKFSEKYEFLTVFRTFFGQNLPRQRNLWTPNLDSALGNTPIGLKLHINVPGDICDNS